MQTGRSPGARGSSEPSARAQRRYLTILFSDLSESTRIAGAMETEDYAALLGALRRIYAEVVARHGGEIVRIDGDGVTVIFGYPDAHEDDGRRATEAALDLHDGARRLGMETPDIGPGLRLHTGVHAGLVLVYVGDLVRGRFEMLGDATNIASRLADLAAADEILVSEATLGSDLHFFRAGEPRLESLRGKDEPITVHRVYGRLATESRFAARARRGLTPFAGRRAELERLDARLRDMTAGGNRLAVVVGASGLGKTRLANEWLARAEAGGLTVHRGFCEAYLGARPLQPFLQILRSALRPEADLVPAMADPEAVFADLFDRLTRDRPVVLFIDDWQWADDVSRRVLDALSRVANRGLFILLASREYGDIDARLGEAEVIALSPLSQAERAATIGAMLYAAEPFLVERIAEASGGNPLLIEELCHTHRLGGGQVGAGAGGAGGAWLDMLIESRFSRLSPARAAMVKAAAVVGPMIPTWLFEDVTGASADGEEVAALAAEDFIYPSAMPGVLQFKHGVTRDAIYALLGLEERRAAHRAVVQALRRRAETTGEAEPLEALAYHLGAAGATSEAAAYAERAGDAAMAASSLDRAQAQYRAALAALETLESQTATGGHWIAVARKFAGASMFDPAREQVPVLLRARERAVALGASGDVVLTDYWLGALYYGLGECRHAIRHCRRALSSPAAAAGDKLTVEIGATLGRAQATACEYAPALSLLNEAIAIKRRYSGTRLDVSLVYSISCRAFLLADQGRFEEAYAGFDEAIGALGGAVHRVASSILSQRSAACLWHGRMDAAGLYAAEAERVAGQVKARYLYSMALALGAYARWSESRSPDALATLVEATAWLTASDSQQRVSLNHGWLAEAMAFTGDMAKARGHAALALRRARKGDRLGEAMAFRALARAAARGQGGRAADGYLARAEAAAVARNSAHEAAKNRLFAAEIGGSAGDVAAAREALAALDLGWFVKRSWRARPAA